MDAEREALRWGAGSRGVTAAVRVCVFIDVVTTWAKSGWAIPSRPFRADRGPFALERLRRFVTPSGAMSAPRGSGALGASDTVDGWYRMKP